MTSARKGGRMSKFRALTLALLILFLAVVPAAQAAPAAEGGAPSVVEVLHWLWTSIVDAVADGTGPVGDPNGDSDELGPVGDPGG